MAGFSRKPYLSFHAKVIIPVVILLMLFLAIIVWLVNGRLTEQFEEETRHTLRTAEAVFRNSFEIRTRNLILRYQSVANEPRFKAVAQLADPKTMTAQLKELLNEIGPQAAILLFSTGANQPLGSAKRNQPLDVQTFHRKSSQVAAQASSGRAAADMIVVGNHLYTAIAVPVVVNDALLGILTIGEIIGPSAVQELKSLTRTEIAFIAEDRIAVSTFQNPGVLSELLTIHKRQYNAGKMDAVSAGGEHFLCVKGNFPALSSKIGYLLLSSYEAALQKKQETQQTLTLISFAGIVFSSLLMWLLIRKITMPLRTLRDTAEAVGHGDFSRRVDVASHDELGELAAVFNQMTENLKNSRAEVQQAMESLRDTQAQLIQTEKLSAMGKFVAGIAHELNNPLTGVIGFSQMLRDSGLNENQETVLNRITGATERCRRVVQSLLSFSRPQRADRKPVHIQDLLESVIDVFQNDVSSGDVEIISDFAPALPAICVDPHQMQQVFMNLLTNARHATEQKDGPAQIRISTHLAGDRLRVCFQDNGIGIAPSDLPNIFNPFFTTKPVGSGTGLGLSIAYGIVREHGGTITANSSSGQGATFVIELPLEAQALNLQQKVV